MFDAVFSKFYRRLLLPLLSLIFPSQISFAILSSLVGDVPKPAEYVLLCISSSRIQSAVLTLHISYEDIASSNHSFFILLSSFFCNTHVSLPYNSVCTNSALCTAKRAAVLTFHSLCKTTTNISLQLFFLMKYLFKVFIFQIICIVRSQFVVKLYRASSKQVLRTSYFHSS